MGCSDDEGKTDDGGVPDGAVQNDPDGAIKNDPDGAVQNDASATGQSDSNGAGQSDPSVSGTLEWMEGVLRDASDSELPEAHREAMLDKLLQARASIASDEHCDASAALREFSALAQEHRNASSAELLELLYNEGRMARFDMIAGRDTAAACPGDERLGRRASVALAADLSDNTQVVATVSFGEPRLLTLDIEENGYDEVFTSLMVPGCSVPYGDSGKPAVPRLRRIVAVPRTATVSLTFETRVAETIRMNLVPEQPQAVDASGDEVVDAAIFADRSFVRDDATYDRDEPYPPTPARFYEIGQYRDLRMIMVEVASGQYNPVTSELTLFETMDFEVTFEMDEAEETAFVTDGSTGAFESMPDAYAGPALNGDLVFDYVAPREELPTIAGEELLILTHPELEPAAQKLADWKERKGIVTSVVVVHDDDDRSRPYENTEIDAFIEDRYDDAFIRPSYILLMGDTNHIPTFYVDAHLPPDLLGSDTIATDHPYGVYRPTDSDDMLPDFAVGRIPVEGIDDANVVVDKIINYESDPPTPARFYDSAALAAQFECCRSGTPDSDSDLLTAARSFTEVSEFARDVMMRQGIAVDRIYEGPGTPAYYHDGTPLPADIGPGSGFTWDGDADDIIRVFNEGRFLFMHRDHGSRVSWSHPLFVRTQVRERLANGALLPVVFSVNCATGWFDSSSEVLVEALLRHPGGGAVGVLGDTRNSPTWENSALAKGFFDAIWPDALPEFGSSLSKRRLGDILNHGRMYLLTQVSVPESLVVLGEALDDFVMWHVYGDPTLEIWTESPHLSPLPATASAVMHEESIDFIYEVEGASVTAFQEDADGQLVPLGRAEVVDGVAAMSFVRDPIPDEEVTFTISHMNAVSESVTRSFDPPSNVLRLTATVSETEVALAWTNPDDDDFAGVRIQRMTEGFPTSHEMGSNVYDGTGESFTDSDVTLGVTYYYTVFSYDDEGNYSSGAPVSGRPNYADPQPDVTDLNGSDGYGALVLTWINPTNAVFAGIRIQRRDDRELYGPDDGDTVYEGTAETFTDTDVESTGSIYYYAIYAFDDIGNFSDGVQVSLRSFYSEPPGTVTGFSAAPEDGQVILTWTNPTDDSLYRVQVHRSETGFVGTPYDRDSDRIYSGTDETFTDTDVTNGTLYYYTAFAHDIHMSYAPGAQASATPVADTVPPSNVTGFAAVADDAQIDLSWTNPSSDFSGVSVVRRTDRYATSPTDGTEVYSGTGESYSDLTVTYGETYYYTAFAHDSVPNYASGAQVSATLLADTTAPGEVTGLIAEPGDEQVTLSWTPPGDGDLVGILIRRGMNGPFTEPDALGTETVFDGMGNIHIDTGLANGATYYYRVFTYDEVPNYSTGLSIEATPNN